MDPSSLIFVALFVAWAAYLIPKALEHHDESVRTRTVQTFSHSMRVLARREPVNRRRTALVAPADPRAAAPVEPAPVAEQAPVAPAARRPSAGKVAARRRRRVLGLLLVALATVVTLGYLRIVAWPWTAVPGGLLVMWLVACRLMVKKERRVRRASGRARVAPTVDPTASTEPAVADDPLTEEIAAVVVDAPLEPAEAAVAAEPGADGTADGTAGGPADGWTPVDVPLPTYVSKPAAPRRSVRTIDLDSTGVWTSGHTAADSALARDADEAARAAKATPTDDRRAAGS